MLGKKRIDDYLIGDLYPNEKIFVFMYKDVSDELYAMFQQEKASDFVQYWDNSFISKEINAIYLYDPMQKEKELPCSIYDFPNIEYLKIPPHLVKKIEWDKVLKLKVLIAEKSNLTFKKEVVFPNLLHLSLGSGVLKFTAENVPSLKSLGCKYTDSVMEALYSYNQMDNIMFSNVNENIFEKIARLKYVKKLDITNGKLSSVEGISKIKGLEFLYLASLSNLKQLTEIENIETIETLKINACKNIDDWSFLLNLKNLKELVIFGTGKNVPNKEITKVLKSREIKGVY